jgi:hypothetical protein
LVDALFAAQLGDAVLTAQAGNRDADLFLSQPRSLLAELAA